MLFHTPIHMTFARRLATAFLVVATTAGAAFVVLVAGGSGRLEVDVFRLIYDAAAVVAIVAWLVIAAFRPEWLPASRLLPAIAACLVAFAVATVISQNARLSAEMTAYAFLLAGLYLLLVALMRDARLRAHFERLALGLCVLVCVLYLLQVLQAWQQWWEVVGQLDDPPAAPGLPRPEPGISQPDRHGRPRARRVCARHTPGAGTEWSGGRGSARRACRGHHRDHGIARSLDRGGRGAGGLRAGRAGHGAGHAHEGAAFLRTPRGVAALVAGLVALVVAGGLAASSGRLSLADGGYREAFATASLRMFESSPLVGVGPGVWQELRASYQTAAQPDLYIPHAHNIYLQTLAEFGLVGIVAGVVARGLARPPDPGRDPVRRRDTPPRRAGRAVRDRPAWQASSSWTC